MVTIFQTSPNYVQIYFPLPSRDETTLSPTSSIISHFVLPWTAPLSMPVCTRNNFLNMLYNQHNVLISPWKPYVPENGQLRYCYHPRILSQHQSKFLLWQLVNHCLQMLHAVHFPKQSLVLQVHLSASVYTLQQLLTATYDRPSQEKEKMYYYILYPHYSNATLCRKQNIRTMCTCNTMKS